jgi:glycosyltransferase involved in cell wall biosynthesis
VKQSVNHLHVKPTICIVAHNAYGSLNRAQRGHIGGVEIQTAALADWLVSRGYRVSFVTWSEGHDQDETVRGVNIVKMCAASKGVRGLRFFHPRLTSFVASLQRANADIYYHNCAEHFTGVIAAWCIRRRRVFVYSTASDAECRRKRPSWQRRHEWLLYRYGLRAATLVIAQTKSQLGLLQRESGISAAHVPMPGTVGDGSRSSVRDWRARRPQGGVVVWIGRMDPRKRLEYLCDIARLMPTTTFRVVAPPTKHSEYERSLEAAARSIPNIQWLGRVSRENVTTLLRDADCLCCTSLYEGFPNTFLEAWSQGIPVVSSFDPDDLIADCDLGVRTNTIDEFVRGIELLTTSESDWTRKSENAHRYYHENHSPATALARLEETLISTWTRHSR